MKTMITHPSVEHAQGCLMTEKECKLPSTDFQISHCSSMEGSVLEIFTPIV